MFLASQIPIVLGLAIQSSDPPQLEACLSESARGTDVCLPFHRWCQGKAGALQLEWGRPSDFLEPHLEQASPQKFDFLL